MEGLIGALPVERSPSGAIRIVPGEQVLLERRGSGIRPWRPASASIEVGEGVEVIEQGMRPRNLFAFALEEEPESDEDILDAPLAEALANGPDPDSEEENVLDAHLAEALANGPDPDSEEEEEHMDLAELQQLLADSEPEDTGRRSDDDVADVGDNFVWSEDYATFRGQQESFNEVTGPKIQGTDPLDLFLQIWDLPIMNFIEQETNKYAKYEIEKAEETGLPPRSRLSAWKETSTDELYRLLALQILMGMCVRGRIDEYWTTGLLGMPAFRKLMPQDRFWLLMKFLHFTDNEYSLPAGHPKRKLEKIEKLIDYMNEKFPAIYTPRREMSIDESLLLWKGFLSWVQCIRTKAARFGMKTYELCEALTGYCVRFKFYTGKGTIQQEPLYGFTGSTAKTVLTLMQGYLGKGYTLFMDNFYNSVGLCRFLKRHKTDVVGTLNRRRTDTPAAIKELNERRMARGDVVSRHCGDVSVLAWKDKKLVSTVSTYHNADMAPGRRAGQEILKPEVIHTYNKYMGGVDLKDQKLAMYLLERKRGLKWYIKVFRRLLNTSILNAYIIHCANTSLNGQKLTHRQFRLTLAEKLAQRFGVNAATRYTTVVDGEDRLDSCLGHFPQYVDVVGERNAKQNKFKRGNCKVCLKSNTRKSTNIVCSFCDVFLCVGDCWRKFHTQENF